MGRFFRASNSSRRPARRSLAKVKSACIFSCACRAASFSARSSSACFRAASRSFTAFSSSRADMSTTDFASPFTTCSSDRNSSRSTGGNARSVKALEAPKSASVCGFDHSRASRIKFWALRSENSTRSSSHGSHSPWSSISLASMSRWPMFKMALPAVCFRPKISAVIVSISRPAGAGEASSITLMSRLLSSQRGPPPGAGPPGPARSGRRS